MCGRRYRRSEAAACAIALLVGLELGLARAELRCAAPVQRLVLESDGAVFGVDRFGFGCFGLGCFGFGRFGFGEGVAGHITVRDPEFPEYFWVNPFAVSFRHIRVSDLILVDHEGSVIYGTRPVNRAAFVLHSAIHEARPDIVAAAHSHSVHGKAFSALGIPLEPRAAALQGIDKMQALEQPGGTPVCVRGYASGEIDVSALSAAFLGRSSAL